MYKCGTYKRPVGRLFGLPGNVDMSLSRRFLHFRPYRFFPGRCRVHSAWGQEWAGKASPLRNTTGTERLSQNYPVCQNRSTMQCRGRFQTCPILGNPTKGGYQTRPYSGCLLSTANCNSIRHPAGSVSALMSWHDIGFTKNSETVSGGRPLPEFERMGVFPHLLYTASQLVFLSEETKCLFE